MDANLFLVARNMILQPVNGHMLFVVLIKREKFLFHFQVLWTGLQMFKVTVFWILYFERKLKLMVSYSDEKFCQL